MCKKEQTFLHRVANYFFIEENSIIEKVILGLAHRN